MDKFKNTLDFIKSFGAAFALVMGAIVWVGKPYADEYIKDTTKSEIQVLKDTIAAQDKNIKKLNEHMIKQGKSVKNIADYMYLKMDQKDRDKLAQLQSGDNPLLEK